ncbi:MAG: hypothetical protein IJH64_00525 [Oscillospiraceae bacterium]|nr:hypothetical protein [Oscillospiraceae bacterium]
MAFTRKFLTALGIESDKVDEIMSAHVEVTDALKAQINDSKDEADKLTKVQAELDKLKASQKETAERLSAAERERDEIKGKYDTATADLDKIKADISAKDDAAKRESEIKAEGKARKFSDAAILTMLDSRKDYAKRLEYDENGKVKNFDAVFEEFTSDRPDYAVRITPTNHTPATPPQNTGGKKTMTKKEIMAIKDDAERQQAIKENLAEFGYSDEG